MIKNFKDYINLVSKLGSVNPSKLFWQEYDVRYNRVLMRIPIGFFARNTNLKAFHGYLD